MYEQRWHEANERFNQAAWRAGDLDRAAELERRQQRHGLERIIGYIRMAVLVARLRAAERRLHDLDQESAQAEREYLLSDESEYGS